MRNQPGSLITDVRPQEYFTEAVREAISNQQVSVSDESVIYITHLLTGFLLSDRLYEETPDGRMLKPLALLYGDAVQARSSEDRNLALQRLGDVSLFISGLFAQSLSRSLVDVDYYIAMGGNAYGSLADSRRGARAGAGLSELFAELASRFAEFVDILSEVSDNANLGSQNDVLRWYEIWLSSGSRRAADKLRAMGIQPVPMQRRKH